MIFSWYLRVSLGSIAQYEGIMLFLQHSDRSGDCKLVMMSKLILTLLYQPFFLLLAVQVLTSFFWLRYSITEGPVLGNRISRNFALLRNNLLHPVFHLLSVLPGFQLTINLASIGIGALPGTGINHPGQNSPRVTEKKKSTAGGKDRLFLYSAGQDSEQRSSFWKELFWFSGRIERKDWNNKRL